MHFKQLAQLGALLGALSLMALPFNVTQANELTLNDTVRIALENAPTVLLNEQNVALARSGAQAQAGAFDFTLYGTGLLAQDVNPTLPSQTQPEPFSRYTDLDNQSLTAGLNKQFRTGITTDFSVRINRLDLVDPDTAFKADNRSTVNFQVILPLLKGRGRVSAAAAETAALLNADGAELNLYHAISQTVNQAVGLYWDYKAAYESLRLDETSEQRVRSLAEDVYQEALNELGSREAVETQYRSQIDSVQGYLNAKESAIAQSAQGLARTKSNLALAIGVPYNRFEELGNPVDSFPADLNNVNIENPTLINSWRKLATHNRLDLQASQKAEESALTLLAKARRDLLPQLNLTLNVGYKSQLIGDDFQDFYESINENREGTDASAILNYRQPLGNNLARGTLGQRQAAHQQSIIRLNDLKRNIRVQLDTSLVTLKQRYAELQLREKAAESYQASYDRFREDSASAANSITGLFELMDIEEKLTDAAKEHLAAKNNLASLLTAIRFQTGVLINMQDELGALELLDLTRLPE